MEIILAAYVVWNVIIFFLYGIDKNRAQRNVHRIQESVLIATSLLMGGLGAMFGMVVFNHKTSKSKFRFWIPLAVILNFVVAFIILNELERLL